MLRAWASDAESALPRRSEAGRRGGDKRSHNRDDSAHLGGVFASAITAMAKAVILKLERRIRDPSSGETPGCRGQIDIAGAQGRPTVPDGGLITVIADAHRWIEE